MKKRILSVIIGNLTGSIALILMNMLNQYLFPLPVDADIAHKPVMEAYLAAMPTGPFLFSFFGMLLAGLTGGFFATVTDPLHGKKNALIVALMFTLFGVAGMLIVAHPVSLWIINLFTYLPWAAAGNRLALTYTKETP